MMKARYRIYSSAILDAPASEVWSEMRDFARSIKIAFAEGVTDIRWVEGGSAEKVPARLEFTVQPGGLVAVEEIVARSELERSLTYRSIGTLMSIEDYVGVLRFSLVTDEPSRTFFEATKEFGLTGVTDIDGFLRGYNGLVEQETKNVKAYFAEVASKRAAAR